MDIVDVKFKEKEYSFHYRVIGVIVRDNKYLIQNIGGKDYYVLPGGHVRIGESSEDTLIREVKEELEIDILKNDFRLFCYHENIYEKDNRVEHWIEQYYLVDSGEKLGKESWSFVENDVDGVKTLNYSFVSKEELKEIDLKPLKIKELIISEKFEGISHIVSDNRNVKK